MNRTKDTILTGILSLVILTNHFHKQKVFLGLKTSDILDYHSILLTNTDVFKIYNAANEKLQNISSFSTYSYL